MDVDVDVNVDAVDPLIAGSVVVIVVFVVLAVLEKRFRFLL